MWELQKSVLGISMRIKLGFRKWPALQLSGYVNLSVGPTKGWSLFQKATLSRWPKGEAHSVGGQDILRMGEWVLRGFLASPSEYMSPKAEFTQSQI